MPGHAMKMGKGDNKMSKVIKKEMKAGKPQKQAVAMAYGMMKKPDAKSMKKK